MTASPGTPPDAGLLPRPPSATKKPRFALFIATACGLGYIPAAPGTYGALGGVVIALLPFWPAFLVTWALGGYHTQPSAELPEVLPSRLVQAFFDAFPRGVDPMLFAQCLITLVIAGLGVWSASRAAAFWKEKDPQRVVVDEVSGQHLTLLLGVAIPVWWRPSPVLWTDFPLGLIATRSVLSWKYLLLGLILFRLFDIWKPFPVRQAESLPGGWGIMADDWLAAVYAAIGLWLARAAGL
ncbi:MAG TPA: phosphatidylglycerophosphatase A [Verrucomicrobiae bacterium]|nr:phosphatidylglycerophosphatase A [Verrucomicrobiae bacterium]